MATRSGKAFTPYVTNNNNNFYDESTERDTGGVRSHVSVVNSPDTPDGQGQMASAATAAAIGLDVTPKPAEKNVFEKVGDFFGSLGSSGKADGERKGVPSDLSPAVSGTAAGDLRYACVHPSIPRVGDRAGPS